MLKLASVTLLACCLAVNARPNYPVETKSDNRIFDVSRATTVNYQLPKTAVPSHYKLTLTPYIDYERKHIKNFTFNGEVEITFKLTTATSRITLHSKELKIDEKLLSLKSSNQSINAKDYEIRYEPLMDFLHIDKKSGKFDSGAYKLVIYYDGILNDQLRGFYRSSYINNKNEKVWLAATHLEPVGARRVLPCFDEPAFKATFDVSIIYQKSRHNTVIFNTKPKADSKVFDEWWKIDFERTPEMSTYLLAIVVSDFDSKRNINDNFAVYARPNAIQYADLALTTGEKLLRALEAYTGLKFDINKMDQAAIPDFSAGAMENWGLVLYREQSLLYDEETFTTSGKQNIVETIAHEFAHQWFGDLVSPKWWKYVWLNEGFATFFQSYITEQVEKDWRSVDQSVVKSIQTTAFNFDSGAKTHPLNQNVQSPSEISSIFDSISYQKGGAIIRMMQHFLTNEVLQKGLQTYLKDNSKKAAESDDLFKGIQKALGNDEINVKTIMDKWVNHKGYPVVTVIRDYNDTGAKLELKQERFYSYNATEKEREEDNRVPWHIPINFATASKPDFKDTRASHWLLNATQKINVTLQPDEWIILNKQQTGYYRVSYDEKNWNLIIKYLNSNQSQKVHSLTKAQLVNDAFAFVQNGDLKLDILMRLIGTLKVDTDYVVWYPAIKVLSYYNQKLHGTEYYAHFKQHVLNATRKLVDSVGFDESVKDGHVNKLNRITTLDWACLVGNAKCRQNLQAKIENWLNNITKDLASPDLKQVTIRHGLRAPNPKLWEKALKTLADVKDNSKRNILVSALGCSSDNSTLYRYLNYAVNKTSPLVDYIPAVFASIYTCSDGQGVDVVLDYLKDNYIHLLETIVNRLDLPYILNGVANQITTKAQIDKLKHLENIGVSKEIISVALNLAKKNAEWFETHYYDVKQWVDGSGRN